MKIRTGFVSNSSSSSFIIGECDYQGYYDLGEPYDKQAIKDDIKQMIAQFRKNGKKNARARVRRWHGDYLTSPEKFEKEVESLKKWYDGFTDEFVDKWIVVDTVKNLKRDIEDWYRPVDLYDKDLVIMDLGDNVIPEEVAKKIIKKYDVDRNLYCLHMG